MSGTVVFEDAKLQAVELIAETVTLNNFSVSTATTFQQTTNASNVTTNTLRFTNPATAFVTTGNVEVGTANLFVDTTTGNVGIGTASPDEKLHVHVNDTSHTQLTLRNENAAHRTGIRIKNAGGQDFNLQHIGGVGQSSNAAIIENFSTTNSGIQFYAKGDGDYRIHTTDNNNERLRILNNGNVGIGTTSPTSMLELAANGGSSMITLKRTNASNGGAKGGIRFTENTNGYNVGTIACLGDGANTSGALCFYTKASSTTTGVYLATTDERMRISSSGNVGIGTSVPRTKLHISSAGPNYAGPSENDRFRIEEQVSNGNRYGVQMGIDWSTGHSALQTYFLYTNGSYVASYDLTLQPHGGDVGIGTTNPTEKFHMHENLSTSGHQICARIGGSSSSTYSTLVFGSKEGRPHIGGHKGDYGAWADLSFQNDLMVLKQGNMCVGINKTNPSYPLDVKSDSSMHIEQVGNATYETKIFGGAIFIRNPSTSGGYEHMIINNHTTGSHTTNYIQFRRGNTGNGSAVGSITGNGSTISYGTGSDYRLKENVVPMQISGLDTINNLRPKRFNFVGHPDDIYDGFIAHELQEHIPIAVSGVKDEMRGRGNVVKVDDESIIVKEDVSEPDSLEEGTKWVKLSEEPVYQNVDLSKIVTYLVKAVQEADTQFQTEKAKVASLLARVEALENA